jgi:hypothetical protein
VDLFAHPHLQLLREIGAQQDLRGVTGLLQRRDAAALHRPPDIRHTLFEGGIDALDAEERLGLLAGDQALAQDGGRRSHDVRLLAQALHVGAVVRNPAGPEHVDVRGGAQDPVAQLPLQAGHEREGNHQRHDANDHTEGGDGGDDRDERLLAPGKEVAQGDVQLEGEVHGSTDARDVVGAALVAARPATSTRTETGGHEARPYSVSLFSAASTGTGSHP